MKKSVFFLLCLWIGSVNASLITYDVANIAGNTWQYDYTINNDTLGVDIEEFTIYFDLNVYTNLALGSAPTGWDPIVIQPDLFLPDDGFYDALALGSGISAGSILGGFSVMFDYLGTGIPPGNQFFEILDPNTFALLDSGFTTPTPVPIIPTFWLIGLGLIMLLPRKEQHLQKLSCKQNGLMIVGI